MRMIILSLLFDGSKLQRDTISKRPQYTTSIFSKHVRNHFCSIIKIKGTNYAPYVKDLTTWLLHMKKVIARIFLITE